MSTVWQPHLCHHHRRHQYQNRNQIGEVTQGGKHQRDKDSLATIRLYNRVQGHLWMFLNTHFCRYRHFTAHKGYNIVVLWPYFIALC